MNAASDLQQAERFLTLLAVNEPVTFQTFDDSKQKRRKLARILHGTLAEHGAELLRLNVAGAGVFVTVNETNLKGREAKDIVRVRAVFADLDGAPLEPVRACELEAHLIVESSPGKWHAYWWVHGLSLEQFEGVQRAIAARFNGDKSVHDLPRVMRLPGFFHKKDDPFLTRIESENATQPYGAAQILAEFPLTPEEGKPSSTASQRVRDDDVPEGQRHNDLKTWLVAKRKQGLEIEELSILVRNKAPELWAEAEQREGLKEAAEIVSWIEKKIMPEPEDFEQLVRLELGETVIWKLRVRGQWVRLDTAQLDTYRSMRRAVMEQIAEVLPEMTRARWNSILTALMASKTTEVGVDDFSPAGLAWNQTLNFLTIHGTARARDEILLGRAWCDDEKSRVYFISDHLIKNLRMHRNFIELKEIYLLLKNHGGFATTLSIAGKTTRVWWLPEEVVAMARQTEEFAPVRVPGVEEF